jgi:putative PIN family toxin of toxin-antitoxin system
VKVVADTNVLVSAFIFPGGAPEAFYRLVLERRIQLVSSRPLLAELGRVLCDKFDWEPQRAQRALEQIVRLADIVNPSESVADVEADPDDNRVLEAATEGSADMIVSGDRHLLELGSWRGIPIQAPAAFLARLPQDQA